MILKIGAGDLRRLALLSCVSCVIFLWNTPSLGQPSAGIPSQVDALFSRWAKPDSPGCSIAALQHGNVLYKQHYGSADIEHSVPITDQTIFAVGSLAKQFTAFAIYLLAQDGKLSLDEDVRRKLPELAGFPTRISVEQLLHQTSGLPSYQMLSMLAEGPRRVALTQSEALLALSHYQQLNFLPGTEWEYSNSNYLVLAELIQRVSGLSFREFLEQRVFRPLGMNHSRFRHGDGELVAERAYSYIPDPDGHYRRVDELDSSVGGLGLMTTVEDLALWDANFYTGMIGGHELLGSMQHSATLSGGEDTHYASGLRISSYRGLKTIGHDGQEEGFGAVYLRFPDEGFSALVLCNGATLNPTYLAEHMADIFLAGRVAELPRSDSLQTAADAPLPQELPPEILDEYVGDYQVNRETILSLARDGAHLTMQFTGQRKRRLYAQSERSFVDQSRDTRIVFDARTDKRPRKKITVIRFGETKSGVRVHRIIPDARRLRAYSGFYFSPALRVVYGVANRGDNLILGPHVTPFGVASSEETPSEGWRLGNVNGDTFAAPLLGSASFECSGNVCVGFELDNGQAKKIKFKRVSVSNCQ